MRSTFSLGSIFGIPVGVSYTWFIILIIVAYVVFGQFSLQLPRWGAITIAVMAAGTGLLFFGSVLAHELAHSLMATRHSLPVRGITLFLLGGVSHISKEARRPWSEFIIALVGPMTSLLLGGIMMALAVFVAPALFDGRIRDGIIVVTFLLGWTNVALGVFNLLPGFPLDGGRVLRAGIWGLTGNYWLATSVSVFFGQLFGVAIVAFSAFLFLRQEALINLWPALVGVFIFYAATSSRSAILERRQLLGVTVGEVASLHMVPADATISDAVSSHLMRGGRSAVLVGVENTAAGVLHVQQVRRIPRDVWPVASPLQAMAPLSSFPTMDAQTPALDALELLDDDGDPPCVIVTEGDNIVGVVARSDLYGYMRARRSLNE